MDEHTITSLRLDSQRGSYLARSHTEPLRGSILEHALLSNSIQSPPAHNNQHTQTYSTIHGINGNGNGIGMSGIPESELPIMNGNTLSTTTSQYGSPDLDSGDRDTVNVPLTSTSPDIDVASTHSLRSNNTPNDSIFYSQATLTQHATNTQRMSAIVTGPRSNTILEEQLGLPYNQNSLWSRAQYIFESILVVHSRLFSMWLLFKSIWPRALVMVDMYTYVLI